MKKSFDELKAKPKTHDKYQESERNLTKEKEALTSLQLIDKATLKLTSYSKCIISKLETKNNNLLITKAKLKLLKKCLKLADNIKDIVNLALKKNCKIRFFEYAPDSPSQQVRGLLPVNSKEILCSDILNYLNNDLSNLQYLALTQENKESLVFLSPEIENNPAVLFTADSDLANTKNPFQKKPKSIIVTSPHHGSKSNDKVYFKVNSWVSHDQNRLIWVRSDCKNKYRPSKVYRSQLNRYCTFCNSPTAKRTELVFSVANNSWVPSTNTKKCNC